MVRLIRVVVIGMWRKDSVKLQVERNYELGENKFELKIKQWIG
jgi:hypothetical protein